MSIRTTSKQAMEAIIEQIKTLPKEKNIFHHLENRQNCYKTNISQLDGKIFKFVKNTFQQMLTTFDNESKGPLVISSLSTNQLHLLLEKISIWQQQLEEFKIEANKLVEDFIINQEDSTFNNDNKDFKLSCKNMRNFYFEKFATIYQSLEKLVDSIEHCLKIKNEAFNDRICAKGKQRLLFNFGKRRTWAMRKPKESADNNLPSNYSPR